HPALLGEEGVAQIVIGDASKRPQQPRTGIEIPQPDAAFVAAQQMPPVWRKLPVNLPAGRQRDPVIRSPHLGGSEDQPTIDEVVFAASEEPLAATAEFGNLQVRELQPVLERLLDRQSSV